MLSKPAGLRIGASGCRGTTAPGKRLGWRFVGKPHRQNICLESENNDHASCQQPKRQSSEQDAANEERRSQKSLRNIERSKRDPWSLPTLGSREFDPDSGEEGPGLGLRLGSLFMLQVAPKVGCLSCLDALAHTIHKMRLSFSPPPLASFSITQCLFPRHMHARQASHNVPPVSYVLSISSCLYWQKRTKQIYGSAITVVLRARSGETDQEWHGHCQSKQERGMCGFRSLDDIHLLSVDSYSFLWTFHHSKLAEPTERRCPASVFSAMIPPFFFHL
ncbi:hypothetical protein IWX92DRAFT_232313 [Phyllosticta citricarpa]